MGFNDGGLPHGARKVKIFPQAATGNPDSNGNTVWGLTEKGIYALSNWQPRRSSRKTNRYDEGGLPNGAFGVSDFVESTALVQLSNINAILVDEGDAFTTARAKSATGGTTTSESWVITDVSEPEEQNGIKYQQVTLQKLVSATGPAVYP